MISLPSPLPPLGGTTHQRIQQIDDLRTAWNFLITERLHHLVQATEFTSLCDKDQHSLQDALDAQRIQENLRQELRQKELRTIVDALHHAGLFPVMLKGAALAPRLYPTAAARPSVDIDLLIPHDATDTAHRVFCAQGWISDAGVRGQWVSHQFSYRTDHSPALRTTIDVHWQLTNRQQLRDALRYAEIFSRAAAPQNHFPFAHRISNTDAMVHAIVHLIAHHHDEAIPAIWYLDIAALDAHMSPKARNAALAHLQERGLLDLAAMVWQRAETAIGFVPSSESTFLLTRPIPKRLRWSLAPQNRSQEILADLRALSSAQRLRYLGELVLPNEQNLRAAYGPADRHTPLWRLYLRRVWERGIVPRTPNDKR